MAEESPEEIPGQDSLYRLVPQFMFHKGKPDPGAFQNSTPERGEQPGMSTLWSRHSSPKDCFELEHANPDLDSVVRLNVGAVRATPGQSVIHEPKPSKELGGRAHTEVYGAKPTAVKRRLRKAAIVEIEGKPGP
jgi:hypothetical protein